MYIRSPGGLIEEQPWIGRAHRARPRRRQPPSAASDAFRRERGAEHACPDLFERRVAARRRVVAERREPAVIRRAQLFDGNVLGRFEDPVADFLRSLDARVDRRDDADENPLVRLHVLRMILRTRTRSFSPASAM